MYASESKGKDIKNLEYACLHVLQECVIDMCIYVCVRVQQSVDQGKKHSPSMSYYILEQEEEMRERGRKCLNFYKKANRFNNTFKK